MEEIFDTTGHRVDPTKWERRAVFERFKMFSEPFHGVCVRVDCTQTFHYAKDLRLSLFLSLVHRALVAAQQVENFRTRIVGEEVWVFDTLHAGSAVGRSNGTIGFGHFAYQADLSEFAQSGTAVLDRVKEGRDFEKRPAPNLLLCSVLPWLDFTSVSHARDFSADESSPRITFGKITGDGNRRTMPVSIHVHHGLADGLHVGLFVEAFERCLSEPAAPDCRIRSE